MIETQLENGDYEWTWTAEDDPEVMEAFSILADRHGVELNSPEFSKLFMKILTEAIERDFKLEASQDDSE